MNLKHRLVRIEGDLLKDHWHLSEQDKCFFFCEYFPGGGYAASACNSLISNFKKLVSQRETYAYKYKEKAVKKIAQIICESLPPRAVAGCTFVPIPPSQAESDKGHDDRCSRVLEIVHNEIGIDFRKLLSCAVSHIPYHASDKRRSPDQIKENLRINDSCLQQPLKKKVVLFDDVLNTGAHFKACQQTLNARFVDVPVMGMFVARVRRDADEGG